MNTVKKVLKVLAVIASLAAVAAGVYYAVTSFMKKKQSIKTDEYDSFSSAAPLQTDFIADEQLSPLQEPIITFDNAAQ